MTIVAGFPGSGHVFLAAESEEGGTELEKSTVRKIALIDKGDLKLLIGGAGHGEFIDLAAQHADEQLTPKVDSTSAGKKLESIVANIYTNRIDKHPKDEYRYLCFELLCAIWSKKGGHPHLVKVTRAGALRRMSPEVIGTGTYLARYLIETLGRPQMDAFETARLAIYVIAQAKKFVQGCGGQTQVVSLGPDGTVREVPPFLITQYDLTTALFVEDLAKVIFFATDPLKTEFDGNKIKVGIEAGIAQWAAQLPVKLLERTGFPPQFLMQAVQAAAIKAAESSPLPPMPDQPSRPPSPE